MRCIKESLMPAAADTTKHENGRGDSRIAPTGGYFQGVLTLMRLPDFENLLDKGRDNV